MKKTLALIGLMIALLVAPAFAVTDISTGGTDVWPGTKGQYNVQRYTLDCRTQTITTGTQYKIITIPARTLITGVSLSVDTVEGYTQTISVGDTDNASGYLYAVSGNSASTYGSALGYAAKRVLFLTFGDTDAQASQNAAAWGTDTGSDVGGAAKEYLMTAPYRIIGSSVVGNATQTTGTVTVNPTIGGTAKTAVGCIMRAGTTSTYTMTNSYATVGSAGDKVGVKATTSSDLSPNTIDYVATVLVELDQDGASAAALGYGGGRYYPNGGSLILNVTAGRASRSKLRVEATGIQF